MVAICADFKWLGFRISDFNWNADQLQANLMIIWHLGNIHKSAIQSHPFSKIEYFIWYSDFTYDMIWHIYANLVNFEFF